MADRPILTEEVFQLNSVEGGLRPGTISFKTLTMESDKFVCVRDVQPDGQTSLAVADLENHQSERHNIKEAEGAIMNPTKRILALRSGSNLQVFDIAGQKRLKVATMSDAVVFWKWISNSMIAIVTNTSVFHWSIEGAQEAPPLRVFDRAAEMDANVQILNYKVDAEMLWLMLTGVSRAPDQTLVGKAQLWSVESQNGRVLDGHAGTFISMPTPNDPRLSDIMCLACNSVQGGSVLIMELPVGGKKDPSLERHRIPLTFSSPQDFPVALNVSPFHQVLTIVTSRGMAILVDVITGIIICSEQITPHVIFCGVPYEKTGGILCVNNQGSVFHVSINNRSIAKYVNTQLGHPEVALRIASTAKLGGVEDLFVAQLNNLILQGNALAAAEVCTKAPNFALRTPQIMARFSQMAPIPGSPPPISTYFKTMLATGKLTQSESVELARVVLAKGGIAYLKSQYDEDKLVLSEELGDLAAPHDPELAMKMYHKIGAHSKVVNMLLARNESQKAVAYCKRVEYSPDWRLVMTNFVRVNPQDAVGLALMLHNEMGPQPILDPMEVVDMFLPGQNIKQATEFLSEILRGRDNPESARLQTRLLEINLKHSHPSVAEKIFLANFCNYFDAMAIAPLCERAQLWQRAIECYHKAGCANPEIQVLPNIRRCLTQAHNLNPDWLIDFFGKLSLNDSLACLQDLLANSRENFKVIVQIATKYNDALGPENLISMFLEPKCFEILYYYLGAVVPYTRNPEVHFRYIEAATEVGRTDEVERMTRESPCYEPERTKNYLKSKDLPDLWPLINVCEQHNFIPEMVKYLLDVKKNEYIEQFVQRRNPGKTPEVVGCLMDCDASEDFIKSILTSAGSMCPIAELVEEVERRGRLKMLQHWLEARKNEKKTDTALHNALAKIYVDLGHNPQEFLENDDFYDPLVVGKYCENRDPMLSYIAYRKGSCHQELIDVTTKNGMWKQQARHLVQQQNLDLWASVLSQNTPERKSLVEAVQQSALPETKVADEVGSTVRAFMNAEMTHELTSLLDQVVVHGEFRGNRFLENLLLMSAIKARRDKVMEYVNVLEDYNAKDIAAIATGAQLHDVAFAIYEKHKLHTQAVTVLLHDLQDLARARSYAAQIDQADVWSLLARTLLDKDEVHEAIEALIRAKNPDFVAEVVAAADRVNQFGDLIKYLAMARQESKSQDPKIDTYLVLTYAKTGRLADLEDFLKTTHGVQVLSVADKCFADGLYDSARVLYTAASSFPKLALTLIVLRHLPAAVEAAQKAQNVRTWKEVCVACLGANEIKLAHICAVQIVVHAEELPELLSIYENAGLWEPLVFVLKSAMTSQGAHMGIFTELGVLYAKHDAERLLEHIRSNPKKVNTHRMINVCEQYHHWLAVRVLHVNNEDWLAATHVMMQHSADCWDHEVLKEVVNHLGSGDVVYSAISFYVQNHPDLLLDFLTHVMKRVDPERVMNEVTKHASLHIIRQFLEATQDRNLKRVNDALNSLYVEEEDFAALRRSVDTFNNFDSAELSSSLEKMELFEFRKIALMLHRKNKRFYHAIEVAKANSLFQDAIDSAAESGEPELVENLMKFFVDRKLPECFSALLYTCYEYLHPATVMQYAWMNKMMDPAMPYMIQTMQEMFDKVNKLEKAVNDAQKAAKEATAGPTVPTGVPLMIQGFPQQPMPPSAQPGVFF